MLDSYLSLIAGSCDLVILVLLLLIARYDWNHYQIPDRYSYAMSAAALLRALILGGDDLVDALLGSALAFLLLEATRRLIGRHLQREALGRGDVKLMIGGGLWVGLPGLPPSLFVASFAGLVHFAFLALLKSRPVTDHKIPFGPYLVLGLLIIRGVTLVYPELYLVPFEYAIG